MQQEPGVEFKPICTGVDARLDFLRNHSHIPAAPTPNTQVERNHLVRRCQDICPASQPTIDHQNMRPTPDTCIHLLIAN